MSRIYFFSVKGVSNLSTALIIHFYIINKKAWRKSNDYNNKEEM